LEGRSKRVEALKQLEMVEGLKAGFFSSLAKDITAKEDVIQEKMKRNQIRFAAP
jgi:hypothetical protein